MEYKFLKYLNEEELKRLEDVLLGKKLNDELLKEIAILKNNTHDCNYSNYSFLSSYIPNYDSKLEDKCFNVLKQLKANELLFFLNSFQNRGNTKYRYLSSILTYYKEFEDKFILNELESLIKIATRVYTCYYYGVDICDPLYLNRVSNIFENNIFQNDFEGPYNMLNYIKNYIYYILKQNDEVTRCDIFSDYYDKKELLTVRLKDISSYLFEIRNGTNLRLCISNAGLSRNASKVTDTLTVEQHFFIDALAFGTTLEKIENRDYEDYKKLLYLPKGKDLLK